MFRTIINAQSIPLIVYTPISEDNVNGVIQKEYKATKIMGVFHPTGSSINRGDMFNTRSSGYEFIVTNDYKVRLDDLIKYNDNYYRVVGENLWTQYGFRTFNCELTTLSENLKIKEFVDGLPTRIF